MSTFRAKAKSLEEAYVYYQRLRDDYPRLHKYVTNSGLRVLRQTQKYAAESKQVRAMAKAEFRKEKKLLSEKFGITFNFDYYGGDAHGREGIKEVIDALNLSLNLKEAYERNIALTKASQGQKAVFTWYPTYFMKAWQRYWPDIKKKAERDFKKTGGNMEAALSGALDFYLERVCIYGIQLMMDGPEVEKSLLKIAPELKNAYASLIDEIGDLKDGNSVAAQIYKAYELDKLKQGLLESIQFESNGKLYAESFKPRVKSMISKNIHLRGGATMEAFETAIFQQIARQIDGKAIHSGSTGIKADNILTIGIDPSIVYEALEKAGNSRKKNIEAMSELGEKLSRLDDGFIVYSSDKNYTLNNKFGGYHAGKLGARPMDFLSNVYKNSRHFLTLLGTIQQFGKGAILEGQQQYVEMLLAQDVAYTLFDDYTTIGTKSVSNRAIHIMNLNGIMIPLSLILTLLADAIEELDDLRAQRQIVNVKIKSPDILFKTQEAQEEWQKENQQDSWGAWEYQKSYALEHTKLTATFLKNFRQIIGQYL